MKTAILFMTVMCSIFGCQKTNKELGLENDNKGEQFLEEMIEKKTGIKIDFTPEMSKVNEEKKSQ